MFSTIFLCFRPCGGGQPQNWVQKLNKNFKHGLKLRLYKNETFWIMIFCERKVHFCLKGKSYHTRWLKWMEKIWNFLSICWRHLFLKNIYFSLIIVDILWWVQSKRSTNKKEKITLLPFSHPLAPLTIN